MSEPHTDDRSDEHASSSPDQGVPPDRELEPSHEEEDEHPLEADYPDADDPDAGKATS